jgi:hypothetical protein
LGFGADSKGKLDLLNGEWEATLTWVPYFENPWVISGFVKLSDAEVGERVRCTQVKLINKGFAKTEIISLEIQQLRGRKVERKVPRCAVLLGQHKPHEGDNYQETHVIIGVEFDTNSCTLSYHYEDGEIESFTGPNTFHVFKSVAMENDFLKTQGAGVWIQIDGSAF